MNNIVIVLCIILWGVSTFLNRLSVERLPPLLMQVVVGFVFICYIPLALRLSGISNPLTYKWSAYSVALTVFATILSMSANILLYSSLKGSEHTGTSTMMASLYPVVTLFLSAIILNEQFTAFKIVGIIMMVVGAFFLGVK